MTVEKKPLRFTLKPSRILFCANLWLVSLLIALLISMPILFWPKLVTMCIVIGFFMSEVKAWIQVEPEGLLFSHETDCWLLSRMPEQDRLVLREYQFVISSLIIIYFKTPNGRTVHRALPRDALSEAEHHQLRIFLVARRLDQV